MEEVAIALRQTQSRTECLRLAYDLLTERYHGDRLKTYTHFYEFFPRSLAEVWSRRGFLHCTNINWILRTLLIASGHFLAADLRTRWTLIWWFSPHQYLRVRLEDGTWMAIDVWAQRYGVGFGDYAHGFQ